MNIKCCISVFNMNNSLKFSVLSKIEKPWPSTSKNDLGVRSVKAGKSSTLCQSLKPAILNRRLFLGSIYQYTYPNAEFYPVSVRRGF